MEPLFGLDPNTANNILIGAGTIVATILASVIGGWMGARATRLATERTLRQSAENQERLQKEIISGLLQALQMELRAAWQFYMVSVGGVLRQIKANEPFMLIVEINQEYFPIYNNSGIYIGQIPDARLREHIVAAFMQLKALMDMIQVNNHLIREYTKLEGQARDRRHDDKWQQLVAHAGTLRDMHNLTGKTLRDLTAAIDASGLTAPAGLPVAEELTVGT